MKECPECGRLCEKIEHEIYGGYWCNNCHITFNGDGEVTNDFNWVEQR